MSKAPLPHGRRLTVTNQCKARRTVLPPGSPDAEVTMHLTVAHISPIVALLAGILILIAPRFLNYVVAIYLIIVGLMGLNAIHHFIR
jgi:hypothetical protein